MILLEFIKKEKEKKIVTKKKKQIKLKKWKIMKMLIYLMIHCLIKMGKLY